MDSKVKKWFVSLLVLSSFIVSLTIGFSDFVHKEGDVSDVTESSKNVEIEPKVACCFFENDTSKLYYSIEDALDIAASNNTKDTIFVIPGTNPRIERNCTIAFGDTLCLPYEIVQGSDSKTSYNWEVYTNDATGFSDENFSKVQANRKNVVTIASGCTLTNDGTLQIGGQIGSNSSSLSGQTSGMYCEIQMEPQSKLISNSQLYCLGYIKETRYIDVEKEYDKEAVVEIKKGTVYLPFIIHDYKGGLVTVSRYKAGNQSPFEVIDVLNIQSLFRFYYPSIMTVYADLYAADKHNTTNFNIFSSSDSFLNFSEGSYLESKFINKDYWFYDSKSNEWYSYTSSYNYNAKDDGQESTSKQFKVHNRILLYGNITFGTMSMKINPLGTGDITITTKNVYFPFSFRQEIHIYGNFTSGYKILLLGGCNIYIEEGGSFSNSADFLMYDDNVEYKNSTTVDGTEHRIPNPYPSYFKGKGAKLFLKGSYIQTNNGFAGEAIPLNTNAKLNLEKASKTSLSTKECGYKSLDGTIDKFEFVLSSKTTTIESIAVSAKGIISYNNLEAIENNFVSKHIFTTKKDSSSYYWSCQVDISFEMTNYSIDLSTASPETEISLSFVPNQSFFDLSSIEWSCSYSWPSSKQDFSGVKGSAKAHFRATEFPKIKLTTWTYTITAKVKTIDQKELTQSIKINVKK